MTREEFEQLMDKKILTKDEALEALASLHGDPEEAHGAADEILTMFLRGIGHHDIADAFWAASDKIGFWWA